MVEKSAAGHAEYGKVNCGKAQPYSFIYSIIELG